MADPFVIQRLTPGDVGLGRALNTMFGAAFEDTEHYGAQPPDDGYLEGVLANEQVIALAALAGADVVGGLVAYELDKLERARREIYIYDLAVAESCRRQGVATVLMEHLRALAAERGAWVITSRPTTATIRRSPSMRNSASAKT